MREEIRAEEMNEPIGHYTDAVRYGDLLFLSGCGPNDKSLAIVGGDDAEAQARQVFENIRTVLATVGAGPEDVLSVTTYLVDANDAPALNRAKRAFFGSTLTASATVVVADLLAPGAKVEVQAVARIPSQE